MSQIVHIAFLWHMHQPWYVLPEGREAVLPWVRLRAAKDYYDMAQNLRRTGFPCTVNFSPSLTEQLRRLTKGEISDPYTPAGPREAFEELQAGLIPMPLQRRGLSAPLSFSAPEEFWRWFYLAWSAQTVLEEDPRIRDLLSSPYAVEALEKMQQEIVGEVLPLYRYLAQSEQVELSSTPFYHPILPLLLDTNVAKRPRPMEEVPVFRAPADAKTQVQRALAHHAEIFGEGPKGMWPAEGAVSPEALELLAELGVQWAATDGEILARTLGRPPKPTELYRPWLLSFGPHEILLFFRDSLLSNLVSFEYGKWPGEEAIEDFVSKVKAAVSGWREAAPPLVLIAMDGENAWDHYERNGCPFLQGLYRTLAQHFVPITLSDYLERYGPAGKLNTIWSGSWIDGDFRTWIGEPAQNLAWQALAEVRENIDAQRGSYAQALEYIYVAEGSDWFWWRSSRNHTPLASHFAKIFRAHLVQAWRVLGRKPSPTLETL